MEIVIAGSPRKGMYSDRLASSYAEARNAEIIYARDVKASPCRACGWCKGKGNGECVQKDGMSDVLSRIRKADALAVFSPVYWWQLTAQAKIIIDRLYAMTDEEWNGKLLTVVVNGAAEDDDREFAILREQFEEMAHYIKADLRFLGVGTTDDAAFEKAAEKVRKLF